MEITDINIAEESRKNEESPIDLNIGRMTIINLHPLEWFNYEIPAKKLALINTGRNVVLAGNWSQSSPHISSGPLLNDYVFSQIHFHWGVTEMIGSVHYVDGGRQPMELHAVHYKSSCPSQLEAMDEDDGILMLVYFFKLQSVPNLALEEIINALSLIQSPNTSVKISSHPIINILMPFRDDYFLYKGAVPVSKHFHDVTWLISREPIAITVDQLAKFRTLKNLYYKEILNSSRPLPPSTPEVFYVNPRGSNHSSLLPVPANPFNSI